MPAHMLCLDQKYPRKLDLESTTERCLRTRPGHGFRLIARLERHNSNPTCFNVQASSSFDAFMSVAPNVLHVLLQSLSPASRTASPHSKCVTMPESRTPCLYFAQDHMRASLWPARMLLHLSLELGIEHIDVVAQLVSVCAFPGYPTLEHSIIARSTCRLLSKRRARQA